MQTVCQRIARAAQRAGRSAAEITLIGVSKQKPIAAIEAAYQAGVRHFGENRVDEFATKVRALRHLSDINWHFIGHLQSRQSQPVAQYADYFHALDRVKIAQRLSSQRTTMTAPDLNVFVQVNLSGEASKSGFLCDRWQNAPDQMDELVTAIQQIANLPGLKLVGLMTMAPFGAPEAGLAHIFSGMAELSGYLAKRLPEAGLGRLSMGMSGDFEIAIAQGATHVRIGSALFGQRNSD